MNNGYKSAVLRVNVLLIPKGLFSKWLSQANGMWLTSTANSTLGREEVHISDTRNHIKSDADY